MAAYYKEPWLWADFKTKQQTNKQMKKKQKNFAVFFTLKEKPAHLF